MQIRRIPLESLWRIRRIAMLWCDLNCLDDTIHLHSYFDMRSNILLCEPLVVLAFRKGGPNGPGTMAQVSNMQSAANSKLNTLPSLQANTCPYSFFHAYEKHLCSQRRFSVVSDSSSAYWCYLQVCSQISLRVLPRRFPKLKRLRTALGYFWLAHICYLCFNHSSFVTTGSPSKDGHGTSHTAWA